MSDVRPASGQVCTSVSTSQVRVEIWAVLRARPGSPGLVVGIVYIHHVDSGTFSCSLYRGFAVFLRISGEVGLELASARVFCCGRLRQG